MTAYYNENDRKAAAWLRELIFWGLIADGEVDERSIEDVTPNDLNGFTQCHFFAGIGGWSYALRLAGWPDDRPAWTGSCPCQPFSQAGKSGGFADERHLWPAFFHLIEKRKPAVVFGEQVASPAGLSWFDLVSTDLEAAAYAVGAADICAAGIGAPHIRQRLYWLADNNNTGRLEYPERHGEQVSGSEESPRRGDAGGRGELGDSSSSSSRGGRHGGALSGEEGGAGREVRREPDIAKLASEFDWLAVPDSRQRDGRPVAARGNISGGPNTGRSQSDGGAAVRGLAIKLADNGSSRLEVLGEQQARGQRTAVERSGTPWDTVEWIHCRDGKARPVEPGTFPLAHGVPGRVGLLRGYGNAIVPQVAVEFIGAYLDAI